MFQYAAGRALSTKLRQDLLLDVSDFSDYSLHNGYELSRVFNVHAEFADTKLVRELLGWKAARTVRRVLNRPSVAWLRGRKYVVEPHFHYWPDFFQRTDDCYLTGYWQSERYFSSVSDLLRQEFMFREPLTGKNQEIAAEISTSQSISLHVRRGDYVSNPKTRQVIGPCSEIYYQNAIKYVTERVERPRFYVFSDDPAWVKQNIQVPLPCIYVEHNVKSESYRDMQLMSLCHHHIIANSSFSWWGAWLNSRPGKIVVAPREWFAKPVNTSDLIPPAWCQL